MKSMEFYSKIPSLLPLLILWLSLTVKLRKGREDADESYLYLMALTHCEII